MAQRKLRLLSRFVNNFEAEIKGYGEVRRREFDILPAALERARP